MPHAAALLRVTRVEVVRVGDANHDARAASDDRKRKRIQIA